MKEYLDSYIRGHSATYMVATYNGISMVKTAGSFNFFIIRNSDQEVLEVHYFPADQLEQLSLDLINKKNVTETMKNIENQKSYRCFKKFIKNMFGKEITPRDIV